jgi:sulfur-carrier protein
MVRGHLNGEAVKVLFYGRLAEAIGAELDVDAPPGSSIGQLRDTLVRGHPEAAEALVGKRARACVNDAIVHDGFVPGTGDRVEFLPPVSGG